MAEGIFLKIFYVTYVGFLCGAFGQENGGSSVAPALIECYNTSANLNTENRPPSSINVLIDLIRKVENGAPNIDLLQLAPEFLHRFRQDGIEYSGGSSSQYIIPYSPRGVQADKNRVLLWKIVPGSARHFPNETLNSLERCTLHFMLSNSINCTQRGDEATVCNKLSKYQMRMKRSVGEDDVETFDPLSSKLSKGNFENDSENPPPEQIPLDDTVPNPSDSDVETVAGKSTLNSKSSCPVEKGVVYTKWGAIQAGTVIAGIAAGLLFQTLNSDKKNSYDDRYAATLAGDIAEAALHQGSYSEGKISIGKNGGWNNTIVPRWYFVESSGELDMTDAEIRAGLDGLILGLNVTSWYRSYPSLRLSQILDMYYSTRGVMDTAIRACNRKSLLTTVAPEEKLTNEAFAFSFDLNKYSTLPITITDTSGQKTWCSSSTTKFLDYAPTLNDVTCDTEGDVIQRTSTDIIIVLDTEWSFAITELALSYLVNNIDINTYDGSNVTIINGYDGSLIMNTTNSITEFYEKYNLTVHNNFTSGYDFRVAYNEIERVAKERMANATSTLSFGGQSLIALLVPYTTSISDNDKTWINERKQVFKSYIPDLKILVLGRGSATTYNELVFDSSNDIFIMPQSSDPTTMTDSIKSVVSRIKQIPRRIINPKCGANWIGETSSNSFDHYVEPTNINYYKISPNYFFGGGDRTLKIKGANSQNSYTICNSRTVAQPNKELSNNSSNNVNCEAVSSTTELSLSLTNACDGFNLISLCPPYYFSVELTSTKRSFQCTDKNCRFPDNTKITISHAGFVCASNGSKFKWTYGTLFLILINLFSIGSRI